MKSRELWLGASGKEEARTSSKTPLTWRGSGRAEMMWSYVYHQYHDTHLDDRTSAILEWTIRGLAIDV